MHTLRSPRGFLRVLLLCVCVVYLFVNRHWFMGENEQNNTSVLTSVDGWNLFTTMRFKPNANCLLKMPVQLLRVEPKENELPVGYVCVFKETVIEVVRLICVNKHWKWKQRENRTDVMRGILEDWSTNKTLFIVHESSTAFQHNFFRNITRSKRVLISTISRAHFVFGTRKSQLNYIRKQVKSYGLILHMLNIIPRFFLASERKDCIDFLKYASQNPDSKWTVHPYDEVVGDKVEACQNLSLLIEKCRARTILKENQFMIQEQLTNVLSLSGSKFDVRAYLLIARTDPYFVFYHPGYLKVAGTTDKEGLSISLDSFWSFEDFQDYISETSFDSDYFVERDLERFIKRTGLLLFKAGMNTFERLPGTYLLLELKFMVTHDLFIWFVEANDNPVWPKDISELYSMGSDMLDLVIEIHSSPDELGKLVPGERYGNWELVYNELINKCTGNHFIPFGDVPIQPI